MINFFIKILHRIEGHNKSYVSKTDQLITAFDQKNPKRSASQKYEVLKHRNIFTRPKK